MQVSAVDRHVKEWQLSGVTQDRRHKSVRRRRKDKEGKKMMKKKKKKKKKRERERNTEAQTSKREEDIPIPLFKDKNLNPYHLWKLPAWNEK